MRKILVIIFIFILIIVSVKLIRDSDNNKNGKSVSDLGITICVFDEKMLDIFNSFARDGDLKSSDLLCFTENFLNNKPTFEKFVSKATKGYIGINVASYNTVKSEVNYIKDWADVVSYDLELWEKSNNEHSNISLSSKEMSNLLHNNGLKYWGALSYQLAINEGSIEEMAEYVDVYGPHSHAFLKENPDEYVSFLREQSVRAKTKNPNVVIEIMVSTAEGSPGVEKLYEIVKNSLDFTDRVAIYHSKSQESYAKTERLIKMLR